MLTHSTRRWLAGLGVAGAFVAAAATPAVAEPGSDDFLLYANDALIAVGGEDRYIELYAFAEAVPENVTITVDSGAVSDFASVVLSDDPTDCVQTATVITCNVTGSQLVDDSLVLKVTAKDTAVAGAKGDVVLSVGAKGGPATTTRAAVEVGEGVDLRAQDILEVAGAPGATVKTPLGVANIGDTTTRGAVLFLANTPALAPTQRFSNCSYAEDFGYLLTVCRFADEIPAGAALQLGDSAGLKIASDAWAPSVQGGTAIWFADGDYDQFAEQLPADWQQGSGSALTLVPATDARARSLRQTDKDTNNNSTLLQVKVTGDQRADLAATGAELPGTVGKKVTATVGFVNNGPARSNGYTTGEIITATKVTVPEGATVLDAPEYCVPNKDDKPAGEHGDEAGRVYFCEWYDVVRKGESATFEFGLRIDKVGGAAGSVELVHFDVAQEKQTSDLNPKNDIAPLVIKGAGGNGGGDGDGGTLPITGESTALVAGIGGLLLAAGAGGYVVARRRRTRFVA